MPDTTIPLVAYFAAHAPTEIPDWFDVDPRPIPEISFFAVFGDKPIFDPTVEEQGDVEAVEEAIVSWIKDDAGTDLIAFVPPDVRKRLTSLEPIDEAQKKIEARRREQYEAIRHNRFARELAWRWMWARQMVEMGEGMGALLPKEDALPPVPVKRGEVRYREAQEGRWYVAQYFETHGENAIVVHALQYTNGKPSGKGMLDLDEWLAMSKEAPKVKKAPIVRRPEDDYEPEDIEGN